MNKKTTTRRQSQEYQDTEQDNYDDVRKTEDSHRA